jgi:DNA-nicking Smr family endonuclease
VSPRGGGASDDEDARAFAEAMKGATPLDPRERRRRAPAGQPGTAAPAVRARASEAAPEGADFTIDTAGDSVAARASGVDARQLRRLRDGAFPIDARLDLHGRSRVQAAPALETFVASAEAAGRRCLLVVHGRGNRSAADGPVVRTAVWEWLAGSRRARASVMAYASAPPRLGGTGATLILLRRSRAAG